MFDNMFFFDDFYDPFEDGDFPLEEWLNSDANKDLEMILDLSDKILKVIKSDEQFQLFLLRMLIMYSKSDYTKARKLTEDTFKRLYIEEIHEDKLNKIVEEQRKDVPDEQKIDKLYNEIESISDDTTSPLDDIETIDDLLDKLDENPDTET